MRFMNAQYRVKTNNHYMMTNQKLQTYPLVSSDSVVECLTRDRRAVGSSLTGITELWSLSKTYLS